MAEITSADLVVLALLLESPSHGYDLARAAEQARGWAGISRPQIYYSLRKLDTLGLIVDLDEPGSSGGPARRTYALTDEGRDALVDGLADPSWVDDTHPSPFHTWLALARHLPRAEVQAQLQHRRRHVLSQLEEARKALNHHKEKDAHPMALARVDRTIRLLEAELRWLGQVDRTFLPHRDPFRDRRPVPVPVAPGEL